MDQPAVDQGEGGPHDRGMEGRVARLEDDMRDIKATLLRLEPMIIRIDAAVPHLATRQELVSLELSMTRNLAEQRAELKQDLAELREDLTAQRTELKADLAAQRTELKEELAAQRAELKGDLATQERTTEAGFANIRLELARKPSTAGMWAMGVTLVTLVVGAMAVGAAYLPLVERVMHVSPL